MRALVTGGGGFLGKAVTKSLLAEGTEVRSISRSRYPALDELGVEQIQGDLSDKDAVVLAAEGCDLVFHVAAKAGISGSYEEFHKANVKGTENILEACRIHGIERLVYTSSPSVVFSGQDMEGADESVPYPSHYEAFYPQTKAQAEKMVLSANCDTLATVALRPHLIWGPEDNHLVPRILERGKAGALRRIGTNACLVDTVYIDNAADAHTLAAKKLHPGSAVAGKAYFISNGEPTPIWKMVNAILEAGGLPPVSKSISPKVAWVAGLVLEKLYAALRLSGEPRMTRFLAKELSTAHWFDISAARNDFGYTPAVSTQEGLQRLKKWLQRTDS